MRLGGPITTQHPDEWVKELSELGYKAGFLPKAVGINDHALMKAYVEASEKADIVIAEVGAWSNPISTDEKVRSEALKKCQEKLAIADQVGAKCCVNIAGARGEKWDGPHPDNMKEDTFALIVDSVREVIDAVKPQRTFYTLEAMPWIFPYDADSYVQLIKSIDRPQFGVHLDPVNMISSVERFFSNAQFLKECFQKLGPYIKSCHAKDIILRDTLTVHLDEAGPGSGSLDYGVFIEELGKLDKDIPICLEHLPTAEEYKKAADYIREVARQKGISL